MKKKTNQTKTGRGRPAWVDMFSASHKMEARTTDGRDWHTDVPNIKLSRAFVVVLVLHVVAIGGILAFEMFKPERAESVLAEGQGKQIDAEKPAAVAEEKRKTPAEVREDTSKGYKRYIVQAGDSISTIADNHAISRAELLAANRIDEMHPLVQGRILRVPKALLPGGFAAVSTAEDMPPAPAPVPTPIAETTTALPVPEPLLIKEEAPEPAPRAVAVDSGNDGFQPLIATNPSEETARPIIVAPEHEPAATRPRVVRQRPVTTSVKTTTPVASTGSNHRVGRGDTLYAISRRHGVSVNAIVRANPGINPRSLSVGQSIRIP